MAQSKGAHAQHQKNTAATDSEAQRKAQATAEEAKDQAKAVSQDAKSAAADVAQTAKQEAGAVKDEAVQQAKNVAGSLQSQFGEQAATQQERVATELRTLTDDLRRVLEGERPESDLVQRGVAAVADRAESLTQRLESARPADLLDDVRGFAARKPSAFLAIALGVGLVAGRLTRGMRDAEHGEARQLSTARYDQYGRPSEARHGIQPEAVHSDVTPHHLDSNVPSHMGDGAARHTAGTQHSGGQTAGTDLPYGTVPTSDVDPVTGQRIVPVESPFDQVQPGGRA